MREVLPISGAQPAAPTPRRAAPAPGASLPPADVQGLWFKIASRTWRTLALLPAGDAMDLGAVAGELADAAARAGTRVALIDARAVSLDNVGVQLESLAQLEREAVRSLVILADPDHHPAGRALIDASDAALVFVALGCVTTASLQQLVEACRRDRWLGAVAVQVKGRGR